jgi:hypothetical protein
MHGVTDPDASGKLGPITLGLLALRVGVLLIACQVGASRPLTDDLARFHEIVGTPGTPYRTFTVEYLPGEALFIEGLGSADPVALAVRVAFAAFLADIATWAAVRHGWNGRAAERYLWIGTPSLVFIYTRFDLVPVALAAWGAALAIRGAQRSGGFSFAVGILSKAWPIVLLPALFVMGLRRAFRWAAACCSVGVAAWLAFAGVGPVLDVVTFRHAQGWGVESVVGTLTWIATDGPIRLEAGAPRIGVASRWATVGLALVLIVVLVQIWRIAAARKRGAFGAAAVAAVGALIALSPLFSLQYVVWLLPWAAVAWLDGDHPLSSTVAGVQVLTAVLFVVYAPDRAGVAQALLLFRNALDIALPVLWLLPERDVAVMRTG